MSTKIVSVSAEGKFRKTNQYVQSTQSRINQLINELGIDKKEYNEKASIRKYYRLSGNKYLGINNSSN
jgi:ribosome assembly protein YihI (activator of Der GTPase)